MKKIFLILLLFAGLSSAQVDCKFSFMETIEFIDTTIWFLPNSFFSGRLIVIDGSLSEYLPDGYMCRKDFLDDEKAFLDTNVFIHRRKDYPFPYLDIFSLSTATHSIGEVFRDEFLHWQQCGMLKLTYEEADSLVTPLAKSMNDFFQNNPYNAYESDIFIATGFPVGVPFPNQFVKWEKNSCASSPIAKPIRSVQANIVLENGFARIPKELQGEKYFIFDMNGNVIQEGIAGASIQLPTRQTKVPAVLSIKKRKLLLSISQ